MQSETRNEPDTQPIGVSKSELVWHQPVRPPFRVSGLAWFDPAAPRYRRLPVVPSGTIPESVDRLANSTAGVQVAFRTDSRTVKIRARLSGPATMYHMPATGQCGFDIYRSVSGPPRYHKTATFELYHAWKYMSDMYTGAVNEMAEYIVDFPLYQGVEEIEIGLDQDARIESPAPFANEGRIVVYGTSITQGGCASRPGMAYTNILSRRFNTECINFGFSGSGRGEPEVLEYVASVARAVCFILDYEANVNDTELLASTLPGAVSLIRKRYARVPILLISRIPFARDLADPDSRGLRLANAEMQRNFVQSLNDAGDADIHFLDGVTLLGDDFEECTVDGVHPNDLGFMRMANALEPVLRSLPGFPNA